MSKLKALSLLGLGLLASPSLARADDSFQRGLIGEAADSLGLKIDPQPEGKVIERIAVVPHAVVARGDPWPSLLNWLHFTTVPRVIERELLFHSGDSWKQEYINESARNLRKYLWVGMGTITACEGSTPGSVIALVVTKDLWSLRANTQFSYVGGNLELLKFEFSEQNLAGRMKRASIDLGMDLATTHAGEQYQDQRFFGEQLTFKERFDLIWNRKSGGLEGSVANLTLEKPLYTLDTPLSYGVSVSQTRDIYRYFTFGKIGTVTASTGESIPYAMHRNVQDLRLYAVRSVGRAIKNDFSVGYRGYVSEYSMADVPDSAQAQTVSEVASVILPRSESGGYLFAGWHHYETNFQPLIDIDTFAVTEDFRFGPDASAELRYASRAFGFQSSYVEPTVSLAHWKYDNDHLFGITGSAKLRYQPEAQYAGLTEPRFRNGMTTVQLRSVSPLFWQMRLHASLLSVRRFFDMTRDFGTLGGDGSLRGYPSGYLRGPNVWVGNLELRTRPLSIATVHLGAVTFFDMGGASSSWANVGAHASVGAGLRVGFPQFNREILRLDFARPLEAVVGAEPAYFVAQYGQAF